MLAAGVCRHCNRSYRKAVGDLAGVYENDSGKWCSTCSGCGKEQAYTRKDHARQSTVADWQCKSCIQAARGFSSNAGVGAFKRLFNKFAKSARGRGIPWELSFEDFCASYDGRCSLTGWPISKAYKGGTASLDRIDSETGYLKGNVQWVHSMVNMSKGKYKQEDFVAMCTAIAQKAARLR